MNKNNKIILSLSNSGPSKKPVFNYNSTKTDQFPRAILITKITQ